MRRRDANPQQLFQVEHPLERLGEGPVVLIALPPLGLLKLLLQLSTGEAPESQSLSTDRVGGDCLPQSHLLRLHVADLHVRYTRSSL